LQKTFAEDINGVLTFDLIMIYLAASTSIIEAGTAATTLVLRDDDAGHDSEDEDSSYYTSTALDEVAPPDGEDATSKTMLPILGPLPMAVEELDMEAYPILSQLFPSESGRLPAWQLSGLLRDIVNLYKKSKTLDVLSIWQWQKLRSGRCA
jgi:hypothetical protein